jgi:hypothetical protein
MTINGWLIVQGIFGMNIRELINNPAGPPSWWWFPAISIPSSIFIVGLFLVGTRWKTWKKGQVTQDHEKGILS